MLSAAIAVTTSAFATTVVVIAIAQNANRWLVPSGWKTVDQNFSTPSIFTWSSPYRSPLQPLPFKTRRSSTALVEALNNAANGFSIQITAADLPRCTRSYLFALQQAGFNQPLDGVVTDAAYSRSFAQTHSLRIVQSSFLTGNRMVTPGCRYTDLIPPLPFARGIAASV